MKTKPSTPFEDLSQLPNLGPASVRMLADAGITRRVQLQTLGAVAAYRQVRQFTPKASLNLLWALQGALTQQDWKVVAKEERLALLLALDDLDSAQEPMKMFTLTST